MQNSNTTAIITIANNIHVTVPASLHFMTTFILYEQNDWFEDEIVFIRKLMKTGMKVIDIGANYGLYTLSIASIIGKDGNIWAFEPTKNTAACLKNSISVNNFNNIKLIKSGLSDSVGKARFFTYPNSELNSLSKRKAHDGSHETISLLTLDHCMVKYNWDYIDFIKIDAEGEEDNILKGGQEMLATLSPLIMFELKNGPEVNLPLINRFNNMGYECYRLVPGLDILIPFNSSEPFDSYLLNLFCCKEDRALEMENEGFMTRSWIKKQAPDNKLTAEYIDKLAFSSSLNFPAQELSGDDPDNYLDILNSYIMSLSGTINSHDRVSYLFSALTNLRTMISNGEKRIERLVTFSRIAFDSGERVLGIEILTDLLKRYESDLEFELSEPFLPASKRYDDIAPNGKVNEWLLSSIIEQYITKNAFSSYFTQNASLPAFEKLAALGFMDKAMSNRYNLVKSCFSK